MDTMELALRLSAISTESTSHEYSSQNEILSAMVALLDRERPEPRPCSPHRLCAR